MSLSLITRKFTVEEYEKMAISELNPAQIKALTDFPKEIEQIGDRLVLTSSGRLIADRIVRTLIMA